MDITRRIFALAMASFHVVSFSKDKFPQRPIKLVVPAPPGGPSDLVGRLLADGMRENLGQPVVVDNRSGAAGLIGSAAVAQAVPDGYTVLMTNRSNHIMAPLVNHNAPVNPVNDLISVGMAVRTLALLATSGKSRFKTFKELISYAKQNPGKSSFGSSGMGSTNHIGMEQLKSILGIDLLHVPYRGNGPLTTALIADEVQIAMLDYASSRAMVDGGSLTGLAVSASKRLSTSPDIPTIAELGVTGLDLSFWLGLAVPKNTNLDSIKALNVAMNAALKSTKMKAYAQANAWELIGGKPEVLDMAIEEDMKTVPQLVKKLGI